MLNWARCKRGECGGGGGGGGERGEGVSTKCCMLVEGQECLSLAHFGQSSPDSSFFLLVRPRAPRLIFRVDSKSEPVVRFYRECDSQKLKPMI